MRAAANISAGIAATVSVAFMLRAGHRNPSVLLLVLMAIWVIAPFIALLWSLRKFPRPSLDILALCVALGSVAAYTINALYPPKSQAAKIFVLVPLVTWIIGGIVVAIAAFNSRRTARP